MGMDLKKLEDLIRNLNLEESGGKRDLLPLYAASKAVAALVGSRSAAKLILSVLPSLLGSSSAVCWRASWVWGLW